MTRRSRWPARTLKGLGARGDSHPDTLTSISNMVGLLHAQGKLGEAEPLYREALDGRQRTLGDAHPDTLSSLFNLADLLEKRGRLPEAEALYREQLKGCLRSLGAVHPDTVSSMKNLTRFLRAQRLSQRG